MKLFIPLTSAAIGLATIGAAYAGVVIARDVKAQLQASPIDRFEAPARTYSLVQEFRGQAFVIDHALSFGDCFEALPHNDAAHHVSFSCEVER